MDFEKSCNSILTNIAKTPNNHNDLKNLNFAEHYIETVCKLTKIKYNKSIENIAIIEKIFKEIQIRFIDNTVFFKPYKKRLNTKIDMLSHELKNILLKNKNSN